MIIRSRLWLALAILLVLRIPVLSQITSAERFPTPLETSEFSRLTTHAELVDYLDLLDSVSDVLRVEAGGRSVEGRVLPICFLTEDRGFGSKRASKPIVFIFAQQHGNEPSGKEAALWIVREVALGSLRNLLKHIDLMVMPMVNADGGEKGIRRNANDRDLNRNHAVLSEPEVVAIHRAFLHWMPEVTLDMHEYNAISRSWIRNGFVKHAEEMMGGVTNLNIDEEIFRFSNDVFFPAVQKGIESDGFTFHRYIVGSPFGNNRIRFSTTSINDGRQSFGIYNTLSYLFEGKRYGDLTTKIERRTRGQYAAQKSFLQTVAENGKAILHVVNSARRRLKQGGGPSESHVRMDYFPDPDRKTLSFPVFDLNRWGVQNRGLERFEPLVRIKQSVRKPAAYVIPPEEAQLIEILERHHLKMVRLESENEAEVEAYTITHVTPAVEEDKSTLFVDVRVAVERKELTAGTVMIHLDQPAGNLIPLLLEPQSSLSLCQERSGRNSRFSEYLQEGNDFPILRLMDDSQLITVK